MGDRDDREGGRGPRKVSLLVRNIPDRASSRELKEIFERYGEIRDVYIPMDYFSGAHSPGYRSLPGDAAGRRGSAGDTYRRPRGFGFIEFIDPRDAEDAMENEDGRELMGRRLEVCFAREQRKTPHEMRRVTGPPRHGGGYRGGPPRSYGGYGGGGYRDDYYGRDRGRYLSPPRRSYPRSRSPYYDEPYDRRPRYPSRSRSRSPYYDYPRGRARRDRSPYDNEPYGRRGRYYSRSRSPGRSPRARSLSRSPRGWSRGRSPRRYSRSPPRRRDSRSPPRRRDSRSRSPPRRDSRSPPRRDSRSPPRRDSRSRSPVRDRSRSPPPRRDSRSPPPRDSRSPPPRRSVSPRRSRSPRRSASPRRSPSPRD